MALLITSLFILSFAVASIESCGKSSVTLVNNGYREVLIGISEKVEEDPQLIVRIKEIFTEASQFLYEATRRRAFFEEVKILIPSNWTSYPNATPSTDGISKSDFLIGNPDSQKDLLGLADIPFVVKATGCGEPGYFVHLTPNYILNETIGKLFGPYGKTLVHEWAHYRWGVYDEYPVDESAPQFYAAQNGIYEGTRCSLASPGFEFNPINGTGCAYIDGKPEPDCIWKDQETGVVGRQGSLMYKHSLYHVLEFCDNDETNKFTLHNRDAPTQQNKQCDGKSVWEVMKEHIDFANGVNSARKLSSTQPEFKIVKAGMRTKRTVLVLDKSGSMADDTPRRIDVLGQVCNNYITNWIPDGEELAVVIFDNTARVAQDLVIVSNATRSVLLNAIPSNPYGATAIGQGIQEALRVLEEGTNLEGGNIILVSDGQHNEGPNVTEVLPEILRAKVVVHTIAISLQAEDTMEEAARQTGGSTFFLSTGPIASNAINEALREIAQGNLDEDQKDIGLDSLAISLDVGKTVLRSAVIDSTLGLNTKFVFDYNGTTPTFTVTSPSGEAFDQNSPVVNCNPTFRVCSLYIDSIAERGTWTYSVTNVDVVKQRIAITVTSQFSGESEPISVQAFWGDSEIDLASGRRKQILYASVSQGYTPILRADVSASVERPDGSQITVQLKDSGIGADVIKDDGVYSAYFHAFIGSGRYGVQVIVNSTDATTINHGRILGMSAGPSNASGIQDIPVDSFQRQVTGGSFQLNNFNFLSEQPVYDPGKITDLQVTSINYTQQTVTLEWTAVGKELDEGQASSYELRYATSFAPLRNNFSSQAQVTSEMILNNKTLDEPRLSGEKEMFTIAMPSNDSDDTTYIFGVIVWDTNGRNAQSPLSNLVSASMLFREHPAPPLPDGNVDGSQNPEPDNAQTTTKKPSTVSKQPGVSDQGSERTTTSASDDRTDDEDHEPRRDEELIIKTMRRPGSNAEISSESIIAMAVGLTVSVLALVGGVFLIVRYHGKRKLMHNEEHFPVPAPVGMRDQPMPMERNRRASFPLRFPRFLPGVNQRPREFAWREVEPRRRNELPPDIIRGNGLGIYDDLP